MSAQSSKHFSNKQQIFMLSLEFISNIGSIHAQSSSKFIISSL